MKVLGIGLHVRFVHLHGIIRHLKHCQKRRGGEKNAHSWLNDKVVQSQTCDWLTSQETGKVMPQHLQQALSNDIWI